MRICISIVSVGKQENDKIDKDKMQEVGSNSCQSFCDLEITRSDRIINSNKSKHNWTSE